MLLIDVPGAAVATTTEVKKDLPGTFKVAEQHRVYVTKDGQPIGGIVSMAMMNLLEDALTDRELVRVAERRLEAIRSGEDELLDSKDFFAQADAMVSTRARR